MEEPIFKTPILFLIFNRPDTTLRVFNEIKRVKPAELYIASDGPREAKPSESELCEMTRSIVKEVDWECEVHTLFRDENLGCKKAVSSAINWFFSNVDEGIILEDDCVPDQSFFEFCHDLLHYYEDDMRVMMVSGTNYLFNNIELKEEYFFSRYYPVWGWATWKRAWKLFDIDASFWPEYKKSGKLDTVFSEKYIRDFYKTMFQDAYENKVNSWAYPWVFSCISHNGLAAIPRYNLVSNIGLLGEHGNGISRFNNMPMKPVDMSKPVRPKIVAPNAFLDKIIFREILLNSSRPGLLKRLLLKRCIDK